MDSAKDESPQKKCMLGWVRFTSWPICSIISEYCMKEKFQTASVTSKRAIKEGKAVHTCNEPNSICAGTHCTLKQKVFFF
jgi:hypothetical protein